MSGQEAPAAWQYSPRSAASHRERAPLSFLSRSTIPTLRLMSVAVAVRQSRRNNDAVSWSGIFHDRNLLGLETVGQQMEMRGCRCRAAERVSLGERNHDFCGGTKIKKSNLI